MTTAIPAMPDGAVSVRLLQGLQRRIGSRKMGLWFDQTAKVGVSHDEVRVVVPSRFHADWIAKNFKEQVCQAAVDATGTPHRFAVEVSPDSFREHPADHDGQCTQESTRRGSRETMQPLPARDNQHHSAAGSPAFDVDSRNRTADPGRRRSTATPDRSHDRHTGRPCHSASPRPTPRPGRRGCAGQYANGFDLSDFVVGSSNQIAYESTCRFVDSDPLGPSLFIHGGCGLGKTHLLQGACNAFLQRHPGARVRYYTGEEFTNRYIAAIRSNTLSDFRRSCRSLELLALDDVHFLSNKKATQNEFLSTFDEIGRCQARVILASDEHPREILEFHQRLVTRFLSGMVAEIHQPDRDMRVTLINRLSNRHGMNLTQGAVELLASQDLASVREIQGTLASLRAIAEFSPDTASHRAPGRQLEIGVILVQKLFNVAAPAISRPVQVSAIVAAVAERLRVSVDRIMGSSRQRHAVLARSLCAYLARTMTDYSLPEIARALGRNNHTTVLAAIRRVEKDLAAGTDVNAIPDAPPMTLECLLASLKGDVRSTVSTGHAGRRKRAV